MEIDGILNSIKNKCHEYFKYQLDQSMVLYSKNLRKWPKLFVSLSYGHSLVRSFASLR